MTIQKVRLGALAIEGIPLVNPKRPWGFEGTHAPDSGDIPHYDSGKIELVDSNDPRTLISWVPVKSEGRELLIADRNLLTRISWDQLNEQDLIFGKEITLNEKRYKLRVLTGGDRPLDGDSELGGFPRLNGWDTFITNRASIPGLPIPTEEDFSEYVSEESFNGFHNKFWNWAYVLSWCQETHVDYGSYRVYRGRNSARRWGCNTATYRNVTFGWRPVLEVLDSETPNSDDPAEYKFKYLPEEELKNLIHAAEEELIQRRVKSRVSELVSSLLEE